MHTSDKSGSFGEPDFWRFDYPFDILQTAFWLWAMSGFQRLPTQDEVMAYDERYLSDIKLMYQIYSHQGNQSLPMQLLEQYEHAQKNPSAWDGKIHIPDPYK